MQGDSMLLALPHELFLRIIAFVYHPWSLEIEFRQNVCRELYYGNAVVRAIPASPCAALLATCKAVYNIAKDVMMDAFTGVLSSQDVPWLSPLKYILDEPRWIQIKPCVKKLNLPNRTYGLSISKEFIMLFPALNEVELFETIGFRVVMEESADSSEEEIMAIPNNNFETGARVCLPTIPDELPLSCNGGSINLLFHAHFDIRWPRTRLPFIDVLLRIAPDRSLHVVDKLWSCSVILDKTW